MKRALLVTGGTVAGLTSVLAYSPASTTVLSSLPAGSATGLGGPAVDATSSRAAPAPRTAAARTAPVRPAATRPAARQAPARAHPQATPAATRTGSPPPARAPKRVAPTHAPTHVATPAPTRPPVDTSPHDVLGSSVSYKYGTLQVGIRVQGGKVVDAWAVKFPLGESQPYSEMAIPVLRSQTLAAQSARIAGATGASFTSQAWISSLSAALAKAGVR